MYAKTFFSLIFLSQYYRLSIIDSLKIYRQCVLSPEIKVSIFIQRKPYILICQKKAFFLVNLYILADKK